MSCAPQRRGGQPVWSERPQSENAFACRLTPPTGEARAVHLSRCARPDCLLSVPIVSFPPGEENRERKFPTAHSFLFVVRLPFRGLRPTGER